METKRLLELAGMEQLNELEYDSPMFEEIKAQVQKVAVEAAKQMMAHGKTDEYREALLDLCESDDLGSIFQDAFEAVID